MRALVIADAAAARILRPLLKDVHLTPDVVGDLDQADAKLENHRYDLVLIDQQCRKIGPMLVAWRFKGILTNIIVLLPSDSRAADRTRCLDAGADDCLMHPFDAEELIAHLRALLRRQSTLSAAILRMHDLEIDTIQRTVRRSGRSIILTPREFDLLHLLATNPGKVLTQQLIRDRLFHGEDDRCSNIVTVYIRYLRRKIDDGSDLPLILTRWGRGYLMRAEWPIEPVEE
jgi:DNA-binding response OmpR family regulator